MVNEHSLQVLQPVSFDNSIESVQYQVCKPSTIPSLDYGDIIRIEVNNKNLVSIPHHSYLYVSGTVNRHNAGYVHSMAYNSLAHLFSTISYELNGNLIDQTLNLGTTTTIKSYLSKSHSERSYYESCGFTHSNPYGSTYNANSDGKFEIFIPLRYLMGFFEDYRKAIINSNQELILTRSRDDSNIFIHAGKLANAADTHATAVDPTIQLSEVSWRLPVVKLADYERAELENIIKENHQIFLPFRTWNMYEIPTLPQTTSHSWPIKATTFSLKPRYIIVAFQTNKRDNYKANVSNFDHINLETFQLFLNEKPYPYDKRPLNMEKSQREILYHMFSEFQVSYYGKKAPKTSSTSADFFSSHPMVVIDCSKQRDGEELNATYMNIRFDFTCKENIPANTTAYCLIIYDRLFSYFAQDGIVKQII